MRTVDAIEADMEFLGRPRLEAWSLASIRQTLAAAKEWDEANPEGAAHYAALVAELEEAQKDTATALRQREAAERIERKLAAKLSSAGLGDRQAEAARNPKETEALKAAQRWHTSSSNWLLLCGGVGSGKSVAAGWCVVQEVKAGRRAEQRKAQELARLSGFDEGAAELERLKHVDLLVLDDVGTERVSDWARALLFEVLDARHEDRLRTILTSNLRPSDLRAHLGERLADRIQEDAQAVQVGGTSLRRAGKPAGEGR